MRKYLLVITFLMLAFSAGCGGGTPTEAPTETPNLTAIARATSEVATQKANEALATSAQATKAAEEAEATALAATEVQKTAEVEAQEATRKAAIEEAKAYATAQAQPMFEIVEELAKDGYFSEVAGTYYVLPDFDESWAQINWYQWWYTGHSPSNFIIRADAAWQSASDTANWWNSGCGFVFRINDEGDHYLAYLALDGYVRFYKNIHDTMSKLGSSYYERLGIPSGGAEILFVVVEDSFTFFVNGEEVHKRLDPVLSSGYLAYTLVSGTNKDFGTRCQLTNVELWEFEQ